MSFQILSSADVAIDGIKCCIYGPSGSGKTPIITTAPAPIILSNEKGLVSIRKCNPPVPYINVPNIQTLLEVIDWANRSNESRQFYTFGLDSLAEVMEVDLAQRLLFCKDPRAKQRAYYDSLQAMRDVARQFRDMRGNDGVGKTVVMICKEEKSVEPSSGLMKYQPMIPGTALGNEMPYFFDEVFRVETRVDMYSNKEVALLCKPTPTAHARDRSEMLGQHEFNPTDMAHVSLTKVFSKILGLGA